jgi:hypothetical protein
MKVALAFSLSRLEYESHSMVEEVLQDGLLVRSGRVYLFSHFSFQEYLAAKDLADPTGRKQASALRQYLLGDDWWNEVIAFYIGLLDNPHSANEWLGATVRGMLRAGKNSVESEVRRRCIAMERAIRSAYPDFTADPILMKQAPPSRKSRY